MKNAITILVIFISMFSCTREMNPVNPVLNSVGAGNLVIKTNQYKYSWQKSESNYIIIIEGTLKNESSKTFYSGVGDAFILPPQNNILFADNSNGRIEKYDEANNSWKEIHILGMLIEGAGLVPISPSNNYKIYAHLNRNNDETEIGKYRLRIDYTENSDSQIPEKQYQDYSNIFIIE